MQQWFALASSPAVMRRAAKYAVLVGIVLITINHGDAIVRGDIPASRILKMLLTVCVPYIVSTLSSVEAMRNRP